MYRISVMVFELLINIAWMSSVLIGGIWAVLRVMRRSSAAFQCALWNRALAAVLALPLILPVSPQAWNWARRSYGRLEPFAVHTASTTFAATTATPMPKVRAGNFVRDFTLLRAMRHMIESRRASTYVTAFWLIGTILFAFRFGAGHLLLFLRSRSCKLCAEPNWREAGREAAMKLKLFSRVGLIENRKTVAPVVWGIRRPLVFLPVTADWSLDRKRVVLLHEYAHVKRNDARAVILHQIAKSLYWFHPGVLFAVAEARKSCEQACDDVVLNTGVRPVDYARHLFELSQTLFPIRLSAPAVGLLGPHVFENRLAAILNPKTNRKVPRGGTSIAAGLVVLPFLLIIASINPFVPETSALGLDPFASGTGSSSATVIAAVTSSDATRTLEWTQHDRAAGNDKPKSSRANPLPVEAGPPQTNSDTGAPNSYSHSSGSQRSPDPHPAPTQMKGQQYPHPRPKQLKGQQGPQPNPSPYPSDRPDGAQADPVPQSL
jgi:beta-lactamase regulating signal transducer with metallopeptidase domain